MKTIETIHDKEINEFAELVQQGIECWFKAGQIVTRAIDSDPEWASKVTARYPQLTAEIIFRFEQIGRRQMLPQLLVSDCPGYRALRRLPYSMQEAVMSRGVEVLTCHNGDYDALMVEPINLTSNQCRQVFAANRIRSLAEQRALVESYELKNRPVKATAIQPYKVRNGRLIVNTPVEFSRKDLARILAEME